jgi:hypothetical protein
MANKETFLVVVGVDEPVGDSIDVIGNDLPSIGVEYIDSPYMHPNLIVCGVFSFNVRFAEDDKKIALAVIVEIGVHPGLEDFYFFQLFKFRCMGLVNEPPCSEERGIL